MRRLLALWFTMATTACLTPAEVSVSPHGSCGPPPFTTGWIAEQAGGVLQVQTNEGATLAESSCALTLAVDTVSLAPVPSSAVFGAPGLSATQAVPALGAAKLRWSVTRDAWDVVVRRGTDSAVMLLPAFTSEYTAAPLLIFRDGDVVAVHDAALLKGSYPDPQEPRFLAVGLSGLPSVSIRIDDVFSTDTALLRRLRELGLPAEIAVPSSWVGLNNHLNAAEIFAAQDQGLVIAAHSRTHGVSPASAGAYVIETVGSRNEIRDMGLTPWTFVQPGTWSGNLYFADTNSREKPAFTFLSRHFAETEAYLPGRGGYSLPLDLVDSYGFTHVSLDVTGPATFDTVLERLNVSKRWVELLIHSYRIGQPGYTSWVDLDRMLNRVVELRDRDSLEVITPIAAPFAVVDGESTNLLLAHSNGGPLASGATIPLEAGQCVTSDLFLAPYVGQVFELRAHVRGLDSTSSELVFEIADYRHSPSTVARTSRLRAGGTMRLPFGMRATPSVSLTACLSTQSPAPIEITDVVVVQR